MNVQNSITPAHFTYEGIDDPEDDLCQGDILQPSSEIRALLGEVHPHFLDDKYVAFLVLTQTCDLVRRGEKPCKSRYINLAAVRPLRDVLIPLLDKVCGAVRIGGELAQGFYVKDSRSRAGQLLDRVLNQNAQAEGLFYLHPDVGVRIAEPCLALLQVSIAVRAHKHYDTLRKGRSGRLTKNFQSKLGWLTGNLFSRVATEDLPRGERRKLRVGLLGDTSSSNVAVPRWVQRDRIAAANKASLDISGMSPEEITAALDQYRTTPPKDVAIQRVVSSLQEVIKDVSDIQVQAIRDRLASDSIFESVCK